MDRNITLQKNLYFLSMNSVFRLWKPYIITLSEESAEYWTKTSFNVFLSIFFSKTDTVVIYTVSLLLS